MPVDEESLHNKFVPLHRLDEGKTGRSLIEIIFCLVSIAGWAIAVYGSFVIHMGWMWTGMVMGVGGWWLAFRMSKREWNYILLQLDGRPPVPVNMWGDSAETQRLAAALTRCIEEYRGVPANKLIPDDSFELLLFADDFDVFEFVEEYAEELGLPPDTFENFANELDDLTPLTIGQLVTLLAARIERARDVC